MKAGTTTRPVKLFATKNHVIETKQILVDKLPQRLAKAKKAERDEIIAQRSVDIMWRFYNFVYRENPSCLKD